MNDNKATHDIVLSAMAPSYCSRCGRGGSELSAEPCHKDRVCGCKGLDDKALHVPYGKDCKFKDHSAREETPKEGKEFTLYDLRGPWAMEEVKTEVLAQLNAKLRALLSTEVAKARREERFATLEGFQNYLLKHGYCDADVYAEETPDGHENAIAGYLASIKAL